MTRHIWGGMLIVAVSLSAGCFNDAYKNGTQTVNSPVQLPPASPTASTTAYEVFSELLAGSQDIGAVLSPNADRNFRPNLFVVGSQGVSIYHKGNDLYITEGLVNRCPPEGKDGQYKGKLAAVLASELGKMVFEAFHQKNSRTAVANDPIHAPQVPGDNSDHSDLATAAIIEKNNPRQAIPASRPPSQDPKALARNYLTKANYSQNDLLQVTALIQKAERNPELEKLVNPNQNSGFFPR
jgi:hypothetical protein